MGWGGGVGGGWGGTSYVPPSPFSRPPTGGAVWVLGVWCGVGGGVDLIFSPPASRLLMVYPHDACLVCRAVLKLSFLARARGHPQLLRF